LSEDRDPAIGLVELDSIAIGLVVADAMVKAAPVGSVYSGTVHPGRYLVLVSGDPASVEVALQAGRGASGSSLLDELFLADVDPLVIEAIISAEAAGSLSGEALGIFETRTVATVVTAADAAVKGADVVLPVVRLADGLGGKGYAFFSGTVADVEAALAAAAERTESPQNVLQSVVIPQLHDEVRSNVEAGLRFNARLEMRSAERGA
jgi:microcompartment protein CcmL/EutN